MSDPVALGVLACGLVGAGAAAFVWSRRSGRAGTALTWMLAALAIWNLAYGAELLATDPDWRVALGDLKYLGICALMPAWVSFVLLWTGRGHRLTRRLLLLLSAEPVALLVLLAVPATHDLVRYLPADAPDPLTAEIAAGPAFWFHVIYTNALLLPATALLVGALLRRSRAYWLQAGVLAVAALVPWIANLLFNLSVGPFGRIDLTPVAFTITGLVLAWGLLQQRLLRLAPLARRIVVERMTDGVIVLDGYGHVSDLNPAALAVLGGHRSRLLGRPAADLLPAAALAGDGAEVVLSRDGEERVYEVTDVALPGARGAAAGRLLELRDVTERARLDRRLRELLVEQARVAEQLSSSLRPAALPEVPGLELAARFRPAGSGREIGGDFYDVFAVGDEWAFTLGDVSGKGAKAAATTAHARYTLRTLVLAGAAPAEALRQLHALLGGSLGEETYLTVVHGRFRPTADGGADVVLALGGHPQPIAVRASGAVEPVGEPGSAIGLLDSVDVVETAVRLAAGDGLFLYTDGVSEARTGSELYGERGLAAALRRAAGRPADEVAQRLLDEVLDLQGPDPSDDIALLVLRASAARSGRTPPAPRLPAQPRAVVL